MAAVALAEKANINIRYNNIFFNEF